MSEIHSYSSPLNLGHAGLAEFWTGDPVLVQEKIDGSQISFRLEDGEVIFRSRGRMIEKSAPDMFHLGVEAIEKIHAAIGLRDGWTYRGEYLQKPKHNTISYARVPKNNVIIYDIDGGDQFYLPWEIVLDECENRLGIEAVPVYDVVTASPPLEYFDKLLERDSVLGGAKIEGVVLKNYLAYGRDKKVLMAKYVSSAFKEKHGKDWKDRHPSRQDVVELLIGEFATEARWQKAVQHLREAGAVEGSPKDIGLLLREVGTDILKDSEDEIKARLFKHFWPQIQRGITRGLPEWYKRKLAEEQMP